MSRRILLLMGPAGIGKTTVMRRVARLGDNLPLRGFLTEELRQDGQRVGFEMQTFSGASATMAHVDLQTPYIVGRYRVDVDAMDRLMPGALDPGTGPAVYVIDEIGKMECLSSTFVPLMESVLADKWPVVATVALKGDGFIERIKRRHDVILRSVNSQNRNMIPGRINAWLRRRLADIQGDS